MDSMYIMKNRFYGANGAVYQAKLIPSVIDSVVSRGISRQRCGGEFALKMIFNYDETLSSRQLLSKYETEIGFGNLLES
jgi:hypothetical protein